MKCCAAVVDSLSAAQDIGADDGKGVVCVARIPPIPPHTTAKYIDIVQT